MLDIKDPKVWDKWRDQYNYLSTGEQKEFHNQIEENYPDQKHFHQGNFVTAVQIVGPNRILEIGGWKGDLAKLALKNFKFIKSWLNVEICSAAIAKTVCTDARYSTYEPTSFRWFYGDLPIDISNIDMLVATHFIEHLSNMHFMGLISAVKNIPFIYFEASLSQFGNKRHWKNYNGTHKLEFGWRAIKKIMKSEDYKLIFKEGDCRLYEKILK